MTRESNSVLPITRLQGGKNRSYDTDRTLMTESQRWCCLQNLAAAFSAPLPRKLEFSSTDFADYTDWSPSA